MVLLHQLLQVLLADPGGELSKQLAHLFLGAHGSDGVFHPSDLGIGETVGLDS